MSEHLRRIAAVRADRTPARVVYPPGVRELVVRRVEWLCPSMVRLCLAGADGLHSHAPDDHVKLIFGDPDVGRVRLPVPEGASLRWPRPMPPTRDYTVRRFDPEVGELDVDLVIHGGGLASDWARAATVGERIHIAGPPGGYIVPHRYDRYVLAGDLTALPAIARRLEELPGCAAGWVFVEVAGPEEQIPVVAPPGFAVRWLHRDAAAGGSVEPLSEAVREVPVAAGTSMFVWAAGEAGAIRGIRHWARAELGLRRRDTSITGYWTRRRAPAEP